MSEDLKIIRESPRERARRLRPEPNLLRPESAKKFELNEIRRIVMEVVEKMPDESSLISRGDVGGICGTVSEKLRKALLKKIPVFFASSSKSDYERAGHRFLIIPVDIPSVRSQEEPYKINETSNDEDVIIDPTIGQFIDGYHNVFVGTRAELRRLVLDPNTKLKNTRYSSNPEITFNRLWQVAALEDYDV